MVNPKVVRIDVPVCCTRKGTSWTVQLDNTDHTGSVLHQLTNPDEVPSFSLGGGKFFTLRSISLRELRVRTLRDISGNPVGQFADLPDDLQILDALFGDLKRGRSISGRETRLIPYISRLVSSGVLRSQAQQPGLMAFTLGVPEGMLKINEVGISLTMLKNLMHSIITREEYTQLLSVIEQKLTCTERLRYLFLKDLYKGDKHPSQQLEEGVLESLSLCCDGMKVWGVRYPNASSTSHSIKTLRVIEGAPNAILMPVEALVKHHQGDCDGDRMMIHFTLDRSQDPEVIEWKVTSNTGHCTIDLLDLSAPERKTDIEIMHGFSERGKWVGMLTYNFWLLSYSAAQNYEQLGFKTREEVIPQLLDCFTPLIEGVMNARKGTGSGTVKGQSLASLVCQMFSGQQEIDGVLSMLPVREDTEYDEEKFTHSQVDLLRRVLHSISGENSQVCCINNTDTGATQDAVLAAFALRFQPKAIEWLLTQIPRGIDFTTIVREALLCKEFRYPTSVELNTIGRVEEEYFLDTVV